MGKQLQRYPSLYEKLPNSSTAWSTGSIKTLVLPLVWCSLKDKRILSIHKEAVRLHV